MERDNWHTLKQDRFRLDIRRDLFPKQSRLPTEVVQALSLEVTKFFLEP